MATNDPEEARRVALAIGIKQINDSWAHELELMALKARLAKARYDAALKAGFSEHQALAMCVRPVEL
jgi:hypothetical protein